MLSPGDVCETDQQEITVTMFWFPRFYNQQYPMFRTPFHQQYIHPQMLQPNPFFTHQQMYPQQQQQTAHHPQQIQPQYNQQQANQSQPPPLIPCSTAAAQESHTYSSKPQAMPQIAEEEGPPPLVRDDSVAEAPTIARVNCITAVREPERPAVSVEQLKYKLSGLQLKQ